MRTRLLLVLSALAMAPACSTDEETSATGGSGGAGTGGGDGGSGAAPGGDGGAGHGGAGDGGAGDGGAGDGGAGDGGAGDGGAGDGGSGAGEGGASGAGSGGDAGSAGSAGSSGSGGDAGSAGSGGDGGSGGSCPPAPELLSETGLYKADGVTLEDGVEPYAPAFELWSDNAEKRRWVLLPDGAVIDTSNMDFWTFPRGTKLWKEFSRDGVRVETRLIMKDCDGSWFFMPYLWVDDQTDAEAVPNGVPNAKGTPHDVPDQEACLACHTGTPDRVLGFSALQLSHGGMGVTLAQLSEAGRLSDPPAGDFVVPGSDNERAALGYLHANCGHCHNPFSPVISRTTMELYLATASLESVEATPIYLGTVERAPQISDVRFTCLVKPKSVAESGLYQRMSLRLPQPTPQMPPLGTEDPDDGALAVLAEWIDALPEQPDGECAPPGPELTQAPHHQNP